MSWWNAKNRNDHGEYEITFGTKYKDRAKAVEKVCQAIIDKAVKTPDDVAVVVRCENCFFSRRVDSREPAYACVNIAREGCKQWVPVTERLPENEKPVLVCAAVRVAGTVRKHIVVRGFYTNGKTPVCDSAYCWEEHECEEWSDEINDFVVSEGWWESVRYGDEFSTISDFVTHWMLLPEPPKEEMNNG